MRAYRKIDMTKLIVAFFATLQTCLKMVMFETQEYIMTACSFKFHFLKPNAVTERLIGKSCVV